MIVAALAGGNAAQGWITGICAAAALAITRVFFGVFKKFAQGDSGVACICIFSAALAVCAEVCVNAAGAEFTGVMFFSVCIAGISAFQQKKFKISAIYCLITAAVPIAAGFLRELFGAGSIMGLNIMPPWFPVSAPLVKECGAVVLFVLFCALTGVKSSAPARDSLGFGISAVICCAAAGLWRDAIFSPLVAMATAGVAAWLSRVFFKSGETEGLMPLCAFGVWYFLRDMRYFTMIAGAAALGAAACLLIYAAREAVRRSGVSPFRAAAAYAAVVSLALSGIKL